VVPRLVSPPHNPNDFPLIVRTSADRPLVALVAILVLFGLLVVVSFMFGNRDSEENAKAGDDSAVPALAEAS